MATSEQLKDFLSMLKKHSTKELDTARVYASGKSEELLGSVSASKDFAVSTKAPGFMPGSLSYENIISNCNASLKALDQDKMDIYYFHGPERPSFDPGSSIPATPLEESCKAIDELHRQGKFERFGVSNFSAAEVQETYDICKNEGYILPTVYQGGYNPVRRMCETELFPTLRKLGMVFYAFSPLAGGYFSKTAEQLRSPSVGGRMVEMQQFQRDYVNDLSLQLLKDLTSLCEKEGISVKEATLRWFMHHAPLQKDDGVILGGSAEQVEENLKACEKGLLPEGIQNSFRDMWVQWRDAGKAPAYSV